MSKKKLICGGSFNKQEGGREFFYALKEDVNNAHKSVTVVYAVDKNGCPIENGNLIVLPHDDEDEVLFCDNINENLGLFIGDDGVLVHDSACVSDNDYIG